MNDAGWNYGSLTDYFLPKQIYCRPPDDWYIGQYPLGGKRWRTQQRLYYSRTQLPRAVDQWIKEELLDTDAILAITEERKSSERGGLLPQGAILDDSTRDLFNDWAAAAKELWRPNDLLATMIRQQRIDLGLGTGGRVRNRKHSPAWGGNNKRPPPDKTADVSAEEGAELEALEDEGGRAERSDRGPLIGIQGKLLGSSVEALLQGQIPLLLLCDSG